ncbi:hypothetical protein BBJ28_00020993, partial [Nothophytophthora sp. Chile5]
MVATPTETVNPTLVATVLPNRDGKFLRGDFTEFKVTNDPDFVVTVSCANLAGTSCPISAFSFNAGDDRLANYLVEQDRFIAGTHVDCVFEVDSVAGGNIYVEATSCASMHASNTGAAMAISVLLPWNADESLVQRVLEASANTPGRKVSVQRTVHGKYGEMSWLVRFISNPTFTPPGAGNVDDITTAFAPEPGSEGYGVTVTQVTPGSDGLSGSFLIDFHSSFGPREVPFDEDPDRLQRKLNEMNTIGRVTVKRFNYPSTATGCADSACSGGWDDQPVVNSGTRGGYRWRIRFMQVTGEYGGFTFPSGSGNVAPLSVSRSTLQGSDVSVDVYTNTAGSLPTLGSFVLNTTTMQTPALQYSSSAESIKQGIEAMDLFGEVDVTQGYLLTQKIPGATATIVKDAGTATITGIDDIRQFIAPNDVIRFGHSSTSNLIGTNGDEPFTSVLETSRVNVGLLSPLVVTRDPSSTKLLYPGMQLRIDGLVYEVQHSGHEIQTIAVTVPVVSWEPDQVPDCFQLKLVRAGITYPPTACLQFNEDADTLQAALYGILLAIDNTADSEDILVSRVGPVTSAGRKGYVYSVYFLGDSVAGDVATLQAVPCPGIASATVTIDVVTQGGNIPHQRLSLATDSGQVVGTKGYYTMSLNGETTDCMLWGAEASDLETALETTLNAGDVIVTRRGSGTSKTELQRLRMTADAEVTSDNTGLFQIQFTLDGRTSATGCVSYGVSAVDLQSELNSLGNLNSAGDQINVTREGDGSSTWGFGYEYLIDFRGPHAGGYSPVVGDVPQLEIVNVGLSPCSSAVVGGHPALIMETVRQGAAGFTYDIFFLDYPETVFAPLISLQHEGSGGVCTTGWVHNGGSVRKASVEMLEFGGNREVQTLTIRDSGAAGTFQILFSGETTDCLPFDAAATDVANALAFLGDAGVLVSRDSDVVEAPNGFVYRVTFVGDLVTGNVPLMEVQESNVACDTVLLTTTKVTMASDIEGGMPSGEFALTSYYDGEAPDTSHVAYGVSQQFSVMSEQFGIQQLVIDNPDNNIDSDGAYILTVLGKDTESIAWDASESDLEAALTVDGVAAGDITVTRREDSVLAPHGFVYTIYFSGSSVAGDLAQIVKKAATGFGTADVIVSAVREGVDGVSPFTTSSIPLALPDDSDSASQYLSSDTNLDIFKVNGFMWTIKFKSTIGNIPALGKQTDMLSGGKLTVVDNFVPGSSSDSYVITNLLGGINYFVHVAASTDIGMGPFTPSASITPSGTASEVQNIAAGYALYQREVQEVRLAATHVTEIQEITTEAASIAEVQTLRTFASPALCFSNACIKGSFAFRVPTVQTVKVSALATITQGTFALKFVRQVEDHAHAGSFEEVGDWTDPIAWDAQASDMKSALVANAAITADDIVVTRDGDGSADFDFGYVFQITFVGNSVAGETSKIVWKDSVTSNSPCCTPFETIGNVAHSLSVEMNSGTAMGTDTAVQQVIVSAKKTLAEGSYSLIFDHLGANKTSGCIAFDALAATMEATLEAMDNIDKVFVTREQDAEVAPNGFIYRIFFYGNGVYGEVNLLDFTQTNCAAFQTQENNALTATGVGGKVDISMVDQGGFDASNTFVNAAEATAAQLTTDLDRLPNFGDVLVSQSLVDEQGGYVWTVAFEDSEGNLPQFICAVDAMFATSTGAGCETDTLTDGNALSGSFVIEASEAIPYNADATTVKEALEAMSWVGTVQVMQSAPSPQYGYSWTITFLDYLGALPILSVTNLLVGTGNQISVREVRKGNAIGGAFTLAYLSSETAPIDWNAPATAEESNLDGSSLQEKLEALDVVGRVDVQRSSADQESGYSWLVTFLDNVLNSGDLPLLQSNASALSGDGVVAFTREVTKGSNAVGDQLWLSFDPPATDSGSPITKYQVRWDTSAAFTANPADFFITDPEILYRTQRITTSAPSLAWSHVKLPSVSAVQELKVLTAGTFSLSFRGESTATFTVGTNTSADLKAELEALNSVGSVDVTPMTELLTASSEFRITFTEMQGELPLLTAVCSPADVASVEEVQAGVTNFRKEVVVFSCSETSGTIQFGHGGKSVLVDYNALLSDVEANLLTLFGVEAASISVSSVSNTQTTLCSVVVPEDIRVTFDRVYGNIELEITAAGITLNTDASIDGVYNDNPALSMSGTFQVGYKGQYTRPLNAESSADQLRYAIEDLETVQTVGVTREASYQALPGKVDVIEGDIFVTCSMGEVCDFASAGYGLPGYTIRIGGDWYTIRTDLSSQSLDKTRLYLGDLNGREVGYMGSTQTYVTVYEWTKGYVWTVDMLNVASPLGYMRAKVPRLYPVDATVRVSGSACRKCYYLPTQTSKKLTIGQQYYIEVYAFNDNGKGATPSGNPVIATPSQVPSAPSNVNLVVVSGNEIEVFFSPPALATMNMSPNFNNDISSYIVQWDVVSTFMHGRPIC